MRAVTTALARLRELGILNWARRCAESRRDGRFVLEQETNAVCRAADSQWRGYRPHGAAASAPPRARGGNRRLCRLSRPNPASDGLPRGANLLRKECLHPITELPNHFL